MGNRGCLHDAQQRIRRPFATKRWIICLLEFRGRHRSIMTSGRYTELFFLDEATALAAGHRPCAECQRSRYLLFREIWARANSDVVTGPLPSAEDIDRALHLERIDSLFRKRTYVAPVSQLPSGVMVEDSHGLPYLVLGHGLTRWAPGGYGPSITKSGNELFKVLTPRSIVNTIALGYPVAFHPSARAD
jgi:hypothetical protein